MNGRAYPRIRKNVRDKQGRMRKEMVVYDVQYRVRDAKTGKTVKKQKRGFLTKKDAEEFILRINTDTEEATTATNQQKTVKAFLDEWLEDYPKIGKLRATTAENYRMMLEKYVFPRVGDIPLTKLTGKDLERLYVDLGENGRIQQKGGLSATTVAYIHRIINEALNHAVAYRLIPFNPEQSLIKKPVRNKFQAAFYTDEEIRHLLDAAKGHRLMLPVALASMCGLRRGECLGLRAEDIDFQHGRLTIQRQLVVRNNVVSVSVPKTHNSIRHVPLPTEVANMLRKQMERNEQMKVMVGADYHDDGWIICNDDGTWFNPNYMSHQFRDFLKSHGFRSIRFHDLRHTCASLMLKAGVPLKVVSSILGHSSITITADLYTHVLEELKQDASLKISSVVFGNKEATEVQESFSLYIA